MPNHKPFSGFTVVEQLPTGDQRKVFEVGVVQTSESLMKNEFVIWVECNCGVSAYTNFKRGTESAEQHAWVMGILELHKKDYPLEIVGE